MDSTSVGEATTVVGGAMSHVGDPSYLTESYYPKKSSSNGKSISRGMPLKGFVETTDYMDTERPFFVTIGKDGLIAALQKLDVQLRNVSKRHCWHLAYDLHRSYAVGQNASLITQGNIWHSLSFDILLNMARIESNGLDRKGNHSRPTRSYQPRWFTKNFDSPRSLSWVPAEELVGAYLVRDERT